jgi:hypothetical protein
MDTSPHTDDLSPIEQVEAEPIGRAFVRAEELCVRLGISQDLLEVCLQWEVVRTPAPGADGVPLFSEAEVERIRRGLRLHHDLNINWAGVAVVLDLLDRIETLEREMRARFEDF